MRVIDAAPSYGDAEELLGEALAGRRSEATIATKIGPRDDPEESLTRSLARLSTDHVDLLFLHECLEGWEERLAGMANLRERGLARAIGISNATPEQITRALQIAPVEAYQGQYNLVDRDVEQRHIPALRELGLAFWAYRPLASGMLAGDHPGDGGPVRFGAGDHRSRIYWFRGRELERRRRVVSVLSELAEDRGSSVPAVALGWVLARPGVSVVLAGARTAEQVDQAAAASALSPEEVRAVDRTVAEVFRPPRAGPEALSGDWGDRERFILERLDGEHTYESIAAEWSEGRDPPMIAAQVKVFADDLEERGLATGE